MIAMVKSSYNYEEIYAKNLMAFEKMQARKGLRPPLPCMMRRAALYQTTAKNKEARDDFRKVTYELVLNAIEVGEVVDTPVIADRLGTTPQKVAHYVSAMCDEGYLNKLNMTQGKRMFVYMKTGKAMKG